MPISNLSLVPVSLLLLSVGFASGCSRHDELIEEPDLQKIIGCYEHTNGATAEVQSSKVYVNGDLMGSISSYDIAGRSADKALFIDQRAFLVGQGIEFELTDFPHGNGKTSRIIEVLDGQQGESINLLTFRTAFSDMQLIPMERVACPGRDGS